MSQSKQAAGKHDGAELRRRNADGIVDAVNREGRQGIELCEAALVMQVRACAHQILRVVELGHNAEDVLLDSH
jgi:hypothetical protein